MKSSTVYNHRERLLSMIRDIYSRALHFERPHDWLVEELKKVWEDAGYKRLPQHVRSWLSGYQRALWSEYWKNLIWVFPWKGEIYHSWSDLPDDGKEWYKQPDHSGLHVYESNNWRHYTGNKDQFSWGE